METTPHSMSWDKNQEDSRAAFSLVSFLLQYPDHKWFSWRELREEASALTNPRIQGLLLEFIERISQRSLDELTENYVQTFDFSSKTNLYITYSQQGEERERGTILVELKQIYQNAGFELKSEELPDFLPMVLEFLSVAPDDYVRQMLEMTCPALSKLSKELHQADSDYIFVIDACRIAADVYLEGKGGEV